MFCLKQIFTYLRRQRRWETSNRMGRRRRRRRGWEGVEQMAELIYRGFIRFTSATVENRILTNFLTRSVCRHKFPWNLRERRIIINLVPSLFAIFHAISTLNINFSQNTFSFCFDHTSCAFVKPFSVLTWRWIIKLLFTIVICLRHTEASAGEHEKAISR